MAKPTRDVYQHIREKRFHDFASVEVGGEFFMTPQDFLESVTDEEPRREFIVELLKYVCIENSRNLPVFAANRQGNLRS